MSRTMVTLRPASLTDAVFLVGIWQDSLRRADTQEQVADLETVIKNAADSPDERLVIAEYDGEPAGAVFLRADTFGPLNLEPTLLVFSPHVLAAYRRKGVGHALMDAAVSFAEELGIAHVATAAASGSRDGNRFLARLAFGPQAVWRVAATPAARARLTAGLPLSQRPQAGRAQLGQVLAARRSMRRSRVSA
jgi:GNAT superfamily N-acetyltransferase